MDNVHELAKSAIEISQDIKSIPIKLTFHDLKYTVKIKNSRETRQLTGKTHRKEEILKGSSGYVLPGQTHFIMGASGAGKTTLLNALSDRLKVDRAHKLKGKR